ncbi:hypothetical protein NMG60_11031100 [Bertholletia excelsa]
MAGFSSWLPVVADENLVTVLSIDRGGIKGIIPAVILKYLQTALQKKDPNARIANHFDVVAWTSTGGLMTDMFTTPDPNNSNHPLFAAEEKIEFYKDEGPHIFNQTNSEWNTTTPSPKYDGEYLRKIICEKLNQTRLRQTLTNVVIPTFDIKLLQPTIFSIFKLETHPSLDALLSDISIATSAAPLYSLPIDFENNNIELNLVDGGLAASNPVLVTIREVAQAMDRNGNSKFLLLSLGTGLYLMLRDSTLVMSVIPETETPKLVEKYNAKIAANWAVVQWELGLITEAYSLGAKDMTSFYVASVFQGLQSENNYLRIEIILRIMIFACEYDLDPSVASTGNTTQANLDNLEEA